MLITENLHSHGEGRAALLVFMGIRGYKRHGVSTQHCIKEIRMSVYTWMLMLTLPSRIMFLQIVSHTSKCHWE